MKSLNSLSGGKTSSYMAVHYPADYNLFALVTLDDPACAPADKALVKWVSDKIGKDFIATAEDDITLYAVRDLEQLMGREITWVTGLSFDGLIAKKKALPNKIWRFCTTEMKMRPIFDWWYRETRKVHPHGESYWEPVEMRIGFRFDEQERAKKVSTKFKGIVGKRGTKNRWEEIEWRVNAFPLIDNKIGHHTVVQWAETSSGIAFPTDSNCVGCFWKPDQQLRKNFDTNPKKMEWFKNSETPTKRWKSDTTYSEIQTQGIQQDFFFGTGTGCEAGYCTD